MKNRLFEVGFRAQCGHIGSCLSCLDILDTIYREKKADDVVILSKGHAALALYVVLEKYGFLPSAVLNTYGAAGSVLLGHPERMPEYGISATTGSLGHGLPIAVGMAWADSSRRVFVVLGDGELQEGSNWEAASLAANLGLDNLVVIVDYNGFQGIERTFDVTSQIVSISYGWGFRSVNGHNVEEITDALKGKGAPVIICAHTIKGKGWKRLEGTNESHYARLLESDL